MTKILMFGRAACRGCMVMNPVLSGVANDLNIPFEYASLDTAAGENIFNSYQGLPTSLPVALILDDTGMPIAEFPDTAYDWNSTQMADFINANINSEFNLVDLEDNGEYSTPEDAPKDSTLLILGIAAIAAINILS